LDQFLAAVFGLKVYGDFAADVVAATRVLRDDLSWRLKGLVYVAPGMPTSKPLIYKKIL